MYRALIWKEWRQLRALRWGTAGLGVILPAFLVAGAELSHRGLSPFGQIASYTARAILVDAVPLSLALGLWPLAALLFAAQSFGADRGAGTELFLLERPVPRARIWMARLLACLGSLLAVGAGTVAAWAALLFVIGGPLPGHWTQPVETMTKLGPAAALVALLGGIAAATLLSAPLTAVIAGLILALLPIGLAALLVRAFPFAKCAMLQVGLVVPWVLLLGYIGSSWLAACRGEPAGRHRARRGVFALVLALLLVGVLFVTLTPLAMRLDASSSFTWLSFEPAPTGGAAVIGGSGYYGGTGFNGGAGRYLVNTDNGRHTVFLPPPVGDLQWDTDGSTLAVLTSAGTLGSKTDPRIEFLDRDGNHLFPAWSLPAQDADLGIEQIWWAGDRLVAQVRLSDRKARLYGIEPRSGGACHVDLDLLDLPHTHMGLAGVGRDGVSVLALATQAAENDRDRWGQVQMAYGLRRFDAARCTIEPKVLTTWVGSPLAPGGALSPSGRYWLRGRSWRWDEDSALVDLETGDAQPAPRGWWLADDTLAWVERDGSSSGLRIGRPGEGSRLVRTWDDASAFFEVSPDGRRLLVHVGKEKFKAPAQSDGQAGSIQEPTPTSDPEQPGRFLTREEWVYDVAEDRWIPIPLWDSTKEHSRWWYGAGWSSWTVSGRSRGWAGPRALVRMGDHFLALEEIDSPGKLRYIIGGPDS